MSAAVPKQSPAQNAYVRRTRGIAFRASVIMAYCRNTGNSSKAAHRLFNATLDFAGGLQEFDATYEQLGRRMLGAGRSDDAYKVAVSRDVATHMGEMAATGYPGVHVTPGKRVVSKQGSVIDVIIGHWNFEALPYLVKMQEIAACLEKENRRLPYERRLKREELFDEAFRRAEVPREDVAPAEDDSDPDQDENAKADEEGYNLAVRRSIAYMRRARLLLHEAGAPPEVQEYLRQELKEQADRVCDLPIDQLKRKMRDWRDCVAVPPSSVGEEGNTSVAQEVGEDGYGEPFKTEIGTEFDTHAGNENVTGNSDFVGENEHFSAKVGTNLEQAKTALDALASVGVERLNVLFCDDAKHAELKAERARLKGEGVSAAELDKRGINPSEAIETDEYGITVERLKAVLADKIGKSESLRHSLIIDPRRLGKRFVQVDEGRTEAFERLRAVGLYAIETSDGNGQIMLVWPDGHTDRQYDEWTDRLFIQLKKMGCNKGSSGASRWPGSHNFKPSRRLEDGSFPQVKLVFSNPARIASPDELKRAGLLPELPKRQVNKTSRTRLPHAWPGYDSSLAITDRSAADWKFAREAEKMGWPQGHVESMLADVSDKAQEHSRRNGRYVARTVDKAFDRQHAPRQTFASRETGVI